MEGLYFVCIITLELQFGVAILKNIHTRFQHLTHHTNTQCLSSVLMIFSQMVQTHKMSLLLHGTVSSKESCAGTLYFTSAYFTYHPSTNSILNANRSVLSQCYTCTLSWHSEVMYSESCKTV